MSDIKYNPEAIFKPLGNRGVIKITGIDAAKFLQSLITNDIYSASTIYAMMLSPQGKYLFDFFITEVGGEYWLETAEVQIQSLMAKLKLYKLRSKVIIEDVSDRYDVCYSRSPLGIVKIAEYNDPRFDKLGLRTIAVKPAEFAAKDEERDSLYLCDKYHYAIPDGWTDMIQDKSMPLEYGIDSLNSIDYHKGCYVGQEVISRTKYQGVIRKRIFKIIGDNDLEGFAQGQDITIGGIKAGVLCSAYKNLGIALLRLEEYEKHKHEQCYIGDINAKIEVVEWIK